MLQHYFQITKQKILDKKLEIIIPPAVGYSLSILLNLCKTNRVNLRYYPRLFTIAIVNLINLPFRTYERLVINPRFEKAIIEESPIFIIGHWRSGTTHLHNLLCQDKQIGFITTYQSVFPDTLFNIAGRFLFRNFTQLLIPRNRRGDNVKLDPSFPQEEEFALGDKTQISFYYFWLFPKRINEYYQSFVQFTGIKPYEKEKWQNEYKLLIKKALKNTNGTRFLSKNPTNSGRIEVLLNMFPNAKFIHIHRNPVEVFLSTRNFFNNMMPHLQLQSITQEEVDKHIFDTYQKLMNDLFHQENSIPQGNIVSVSFNELEENPVAVLKTIYRELNINGYQKAEPQFLNYINQSSNYKKNGHLITRSQLKRIKKEYGFAMNKLNYMIPQNLEILDD